MVSEQHDCLDIEENHISSHQESIICTRTVSSEVQCCELKAYTNTNVKHCNTKEFKNAEELKRLSQSNFETRIEIFFNSAFRSKSFMKAYHKNT